MEKLRQAIRNLEAQAEKYERHLGAERFPSPPEEFFDNLTESVDIIREDLAIPQPKPVVPAKGEESPV